MAILSLAPSTGRSEDHVSGSDDLTRVLGEQLRHRVADLAVESSGKKCITVTGRSKTYHGKQLATHALFLAVPGVAVRNDIIVRDD